MSTKDPCIGCGHDRLEHTLTWVRNGSDWMEVRDDYPGNECLTCWERDGHTCRFSDSPNDADIEAMYGGPSAQETYMRDWQQHQDLHR